MSDLNCYDLLGIEPSSTQNQINTGYRRAARLHHPDKAGNSPSSREKFHQISVAYQLLSDPILKAKYDSARALQNQKARQAELFEGKRRQMKDDLESREKAFKRGRDDNGMDHAEQTFKQLAAEGKRRRLEKQDTLKRELEQERANANKNVNSPATDQISSVPELDRTVRVRWPIESADDMVEESHIMSLFSTFGKVESVTMLGAKPQKNKRVVICMVQYVSIVGAHSAVKEFPRQKGKEWERFDLVYWAGNKEPDSISEQRSDLNNARLSNHISPLTPATASRPATPTPSGSTSHNKKMPAFPSFSTAFGTPKGSPLSRSVGFNSPSLEEMTMIRLKNAEKARLAEELKREDDAAMGIRNST
ncbi:MAG: hypothetical protein LQ337_005763 [Flavoplaca oasis]|nr:MAG: hypothetical protein LQ337_005763 [Flavoplaca oasis]